MQLPRQTNRIQSLCALTITLLLILYAAPVHGDSDYCSVFPSSVAASLAAAASGNYSEYSSCCGISASASTIYLSTNDLFAAAATSLPFIACRTTTANRCCPYSNSALPVYTDTTGRAIPYTFQTVLSDTIYQCVQPLSRGGCCADSECAALGDPGTDRDWSCSSGLCHLRCPYRPLSLTRIILLFAVPVIVAILELLFFFCDCRLVSLDFTCCGFGSEIALVRFFGLMLRAGFYKFLVMVNLSLAFAAHLWNAISPPSACAHEGYGDAMSFVWACMYASIFFIAFLCRTRHLVEREGFHDAYQDILLYMKFAHIFPFVWVMVVGPAQSGLDHFLLVQQALSFRWMPLLILATPWLLFYNPSKDRPFFTGVFQVLDMYFWKSHVSHFIREGRSRNVGYIRRAYADAVDAESKTARLQSAGQGVPALASTLKALEAAREFVAYVNCCCCKTCAIAREEPEYAQTSVPDLVSPRGAVNRAALPPPEIQMAALASPSPPRTPRRDDGTLRAESVVAEVDENNRIVQLHISMPSEGANSLFLPPASVAPLQLPPPRVTPSGTPRSPANPMVPSTASILRQYPDSARQGGTSGAGKLRNPFSDSSEDEDDDGQPSARPKIHSARGKANMLALPEPTPPAAAPTSTFLNPWSSSLDSSRREAHRKAEQEAKEQLAEKQKQAEDEEEEQNNPTAAGKPMDVSELDAPSSSTPPLKPQKLDWADASSSSVALTPSKPDEKLLSDTQPTSSPQQQVEKGTVVDGSYVPPKGGSLAFQPRALTDIGIDDAAAARQLEEDDRRRLMQLEEEKLSARSGRQSRR